MSETVSDGPFSGPRPVVWMVECGGTAACLGAEQDRHPASVISGEAAEEEVTLHRPQHHGRVLHTHHHLHPHLDGDSSVTFE